MKISIRENRSNVRRYNKYLRIRCEIKNGPQGYFLYDFASAPMISSIGQSPLVRGKKVRKHSFYAVTERAHGMTGHLISHRGVRPVVVAVRDVGTGGRRGRSFRSDGPSAAAG